MQNKRNRKESSEWLSTWGAVANNQMIVVSGWNGDASHLPVSTNFANVGSNCDFDTFVTDDRTWSVTVVTFCELTNNNSIGL
jgi:hypothetical protein